jgi:hypothetical protein
MRRPAPPLSKETETGGLSVCRENRLPMATVFMEI